VSNGGVDDLHNEQLAFVSGTILAWGALLIKLWPIVAQMQTGHHARALPQRVPISVAPITVLSHRAAALVIALGVAMLLFGTVHVMARGLWLARSRAEAPIGTVNTALDTAHRAYLIIQVYWVLTLGALLFGILSFPVVLGLVRGFNWSPLWACLVPALLLTTAITATNIRRRRRSPDAKHPFFRRFGKTNVLIATSAMLVLWPTVVELSYTAELHVNPPVVRHSEHEVVQVQVELGGAVSDPKEAALTLFRDSAPVASLKLRSLGNGSYVALVAANALPPSDYEVRLTYPHLYIAINQPTFSALIDKRAGFIVTR
jgi:hypothetical protein